MNEHLKNKLIAKLKSPGYQDHKLTLTRRELLRLGLIAGGGAFLPLTFAERALGLTAAETKTPFLVIDLAGGASLPGNFLVGQKGGPEDLCQNYSGHGWNPRATGALDRTFGLPMNKKTGKIFEGLMATLPKEISGNENQSMFKMASLCHFSLDDTNTNRASALTMVAKSGVQGSLIKAGIGFRPTVSGSNASSYLEDSKFKPKSVSSADEIMKLTSFGPEFEALPPKERHAIFQNLTLAAGNNAQLASIYEDLSKLGMTDLRTDVLISPEITKLYSVNQRTDAGALQASLVYNLLNGYTGPSAITIEGCDYHDNTQTTGDAKDLEIGQTIGRAVAAAFALKKPLFLQIITDGGIYSPDSANFERKWVGDSNESSMSVVGYFHPTRKVELRKTQVGNYTTSGKVDQKTFIGAGPEKMALAVIGNYLNLHGRLDTFEDVAGARLQSNELEEILVFA